ncbi:MAG TPA: hypothetical protein VGH28_06795 [Polyangiaceae bacterium]|jgi:hypothetical protein
MTGELSPRARELFEAAKVDAPSDSARDAMWAGIQMAALAPPASTPGAPASNPAAHLAVKAAATSKLAMGIALGASITVGVAGAVIALARPWAPPVTHVAQPRELERSEVDRASVDRAQDLELPATPVVITGHAVNPTDAVELDPVAAPEKTAARPLSEHDRLAQEARMVSEARGALHRGEPATALRIVRAARGTHGARLVPEELTVEAQALRAMGDEAGAKRAEAELSGRFPEQDLGQ